jgi:hypothetical protein
MQLTVVVYLDDCLLAGKHNWTIRHNYDHAMRQGYLCKRNTATAAAEQQQQECKPPQHTKRSRHLLDIRVHRSLMFSTEAYGLLPNP